MPAVQLNADDARAIAHDLAIDLATAAWLHPVVHGLARRKDPHAHDLVLAVDRLFASSIVVTLSKFCEFHDRFASLMPNELRKESGALKADLVSRGVLDFRSKYLAHIWDNETRAPLPSAIVDQHVERITGVKMNAEWAPFWHWLANIDAPSDANTVAGLLDRIEQSLPGAR